MPNVISSKHLKKIVSKLQKQTAPSLWKRTLQMQEEKKRHITFRYLLGNFIAEKAAKQRKIKEGKKVNMSTCCPLLNKLSLKNEAR